MVTVSVVPYDGHGEGLTWIDTAKVADQVLTESFTGHRTSSWPATWTAEGTTLNTVSILNNQGNRSQM